MSEIRPTPAQELCTVELVPADHVRVAIDEWEAQCRAICAEVEADGLDRSLVEGVVKDIVFDDDHGQHVAYDGANWWTWADTSWTAGRPVGALRPRRIAMDLHVVPWADEPADETAGDATEDSESESEPFLATDVVPAGGLVSADGVALDPGLDLMVTEWRSDGWARIRCSNGWTTWVDGGQLGS